MRWAAPLGAEEGGKGTEVSRGGVGAGAGRLETTVAVGGWVPSLFSRQPQGGRDMSHTLEPDRTHPKCTNSQNEETFCLPKKDGHTHKLKLSLLT